MNRRLIAAVAVVFGISSLRAWGKQPGDGAPAPKPKPVVATPSEPELPQLPELVDGTPPADDAKDLQLRRDLKRLVVRKLSLKYVEKLLTVQFPFSQADDRSLGDLPILTRPFVLKFDSSGSVSDVGFAHLAKQKNLVGLELFSNTPISPAGLAHLKGLPLRTLFARGYPLTDDAAVAVLGEFTSLERLHLSTTDEPSDKLDLAPLAKLKRLRELNFYFFRTTGASLRHFADLTELEDLAFHDAPDVRDHDLRHLAKLSKLRRFKLNGDRVTGSGLAGIGERLDILDISGCGQLDDIGFAAVARFRNLRELDLDGTFISAQGLAAIAGLTKLEQLDVPPQIDDAGMAHLAELTQVRELSLYKRPITDAGLKHLAKWTELEELEIQHCAKITGSGFAALARASKLKQLYIPEMPGLTDAGLQGIGELLQLQRLVLPPQITDAGLKHLAPLVNLKSLSLDKAKLTDSGLAQLAPLIALETLSLNDVPVTDAAIPTFAKFNKLSILDVNRSNITAEGVKRLKELSPNKRLYVSGR